MVEIDEHVCFFNSMPLLVNCNPTMDFQAMRGLRYGDPLSPFMFLLVAKELAGFMQNDPQLGEFHLFKVIEDMQFELLLFAD